MLERIFYPTFMKFDPTKLGYAENLYEQIQGKAWWHPSYYHRCIIFISQYVNYYDVASYALAGFLKQIEEFKW